MKDAIWTELPIIAEDAMVDEPPDDVLFDAVVPALVFMFEVSSEATRRISWSIVKFHYSSLI